MRMESEPQREAHSRRPNGEGVALRFEIQCGRVRVHETRTVVWRFRELKALDGLHRLERALQPVEHLVQHRALLHAPVGGRGGEWPSADDRADLSRLSRPHSPRAPPLPCSRHRSAVRPLPSAGAWVPHMMRRWSSSPTQIAKPLSADT